MPDTEPEANVPSRPTTQETKVSGKGASDPPPAVRNSGTYFPKPRTFKSKEEEREFLKFRLAQALRIFGNLG